MAKSKKPVDTRRCWLCGECGTVHEGKDPPDDCSYCGYKFFESLFDLERERAGWVRKGVFKASTSTGGSTDSTESSTSEKATLEELRRTLH